MFIPAAIKNAGEGKKFRRVIAIDCIQGWVGPRTFGFDGRYATERDERISIFALSKPSSFN
jgi:hypothetical protein